MRTNKLSMFLGAAAVLTVGSFVFVPTDAWAVCCGKYDYGYEDSGNELVIGQLSERINAMELAIIESLRLGTGQVSGNLKEQIGAGSNLANAQDDRKVVQEIEKVRLQAMADSASGVMACQILTQNASLPTMEANTAAAKRSLAQELIAWSRGDEGQKSSEGPEMASRALNATHCATYATRQDITSGLCPAGSPVDGPLANASMDASGSLFFMRDGELSSTLSSDRIQAALRFSETLIDPVPLGPLSPGEAAAAGGAEEATRRRKITARYSVSSDTLLDIVTRRSPQSDLKYASTIESAASQINGYKGSWPEGVSVYDALDIRARSWYENITWGVDHNSSNPASVAKDQSMMLAYMAYVSWESLKAQEKTNLLLATISANLTDMNRKK